MALRSRLVATLGAFMAEPTRPARLAELRSEAVAYHAAVLAGAVPREGRSPASRQSLFAEILRAELALVLAGDPPDVLIEQADRYVEEARTGSIEPPRPPLMSISRPFATFNHPPKDFS
ncbi:MAG: hypothetical protein O9972_15460 [Burkholderiales bacterium]|nr:hypothetical protein [Burkholderiales bacterium]